MSEDKTRILLVRGGQHWQLQTGFRYPNGGGGVVHNIGTVRTLGHKPPYEMADRLLKQEHGVQVTDWVKHDPTLPDYPVWRAVY